MLNVTGMASVPCYNGGITGNYYIEFGKKMAITEVWDDGSKNVGLKM